MVKTRKPFHVLSRTKGILAFRLLESSTLAVSLQVHVKRLGHARRSRTTEMSDSHWSASTRHEAPRPCQQIHHSKRTLTKLRQLFQKHAVASMIACNYTGEKLNLNVSPGLLLAFWNARPANSLGDRRIVPSTYFMSSTMNMSTSASQAGERTEVIVAALGHLGS